jgi:hypothetical protein
MVFLPLQPDRDREKPALIRGRVKIGAGWRMAGGLASLFDLPGCDTNKNHFTSLISQKFPETTGNAGNPSHFPVQTCHSR